jgi:hypothetical protein
LAGDIVEFSMPPPLNTSGMRLVRLGVTMTPVVRFAERRRAWRSGRINAEGQAVIAERWL